LFKFLARILDKFAPPKVLTKKKLKQLEDLIKHKINNPDLFVEALTHRSNLDHRRFKNSNERLEFLGDSVIGFVVAEVLFHDFLDKDEGYLTKIRSNFVNKNSLYDAAVRIDLIHYLFISKDLLAVSNIGIKTILADAFESLVGAVYLDCGIEAAKDFIQFYVIQPNFKIGLHLVDENYKSQLLEYSQAVKLDMPKYIVIREEGPEHDRIFTVQVRIGADVWGEGKGKNKKSAEQEAAKEAISKIASYKKERT
jgi:ribonuclease-3